jgi:general secretion pathway protein H
MPISAAGNRPRLRWSAEHGFTPVRRAAEDGFTLVELMVVVTIIGLASAIAVWALPDPRGRITDEAAKFALRVKGAHDTAIIEARPVSLWVTSGGYGFDRRIAGSWSPIAEKPLRVARWTDGTSAAIGGGDGRARVTFDETGLADRAATVTLRRSGARADVQIDADGSVRVVG